MNFNEFVNEVKDNIKLFLPRDYENAEVSTMECHKLNRAYTGLMVRKEGEMLTPTINLNRLYEAYKAQPGVTMETVCRKIADIVIEAPIQVDLKAILNYEDVKDKLFIRVSSAEANKEVLEIVPHQLKEDLAITYHVAVGKNQDGLKKTDRYWLVHKNVFESKEIAGKIRINIASFEKWYANQIKYHKVTGEEPGKELKSWSYSVKEVADLLGVDEYEWYVRDSSRKIKSVLRAKGMSGIHTNSIGIYGYKKDPNDKNHWIVDDEAAEVVRRIYRMAIEGKGPYEIARILDSEKVERPSYYLAQRGLGKHKTSYNPDEPYTWRGGTVADILSKPEYIGHTVNFRTYKESYKDKHSKMTPKEDLVIFENTQEAIIDKETWERVQTLRKTIRRTDTIGTANPLTGLMFCADCGAKMYNHRGKAGNARDWAGRPTGKKRPDRDEYNCSRYDLGNQHFDDYCTTHLIRTAVVNELLLEAIKEVCDYAQNNEAEFMAQVCSASEDRQAKAAKAIRQRKQRSEKRTDELSRLIRKLYEDNVNGRLSDKLFEQMLHDFEAELEGLTDSITQDQQELDRISRETVNAEKFLALVKKYTDFSELTPAMINEFVEKILVHQAEGKGASRTQEVEIFFNFIGKVEIPRKEIELTEEEKAALAEQERRRAKKAEYNRRYMEKKRRQWKEQQEREKEQQEALELPAASTEKGERIA